MCMELTKEGYHIILECGNLTAREEHCDIMIYLQCIQICECCKHAIVHVCEVLACRDGKVYCYKI